ncbi:MAG: hypothetical protein ABIS23_00225 [Sphingomicrobium sp.]
MKFGTILFAVLATGSAAPALSAPAPPPPGVVAADPAKQALAARVAASLWPDGTYGRMVESMFGGKDGLTDMVLDMRPADLMVTMAQAFAEDGKTKAKAKGPPEPPSPTIREMMIAKDPHFEERTRITMKVVGEEVRRIATPIEPKFRGGLAKSIARRFTSEQLGPIAAFLETEPGRAYAAQSITLFIDKDVILALIQSVPAMIKEMPAAMEKVERATAHLPKPPKDKPPADTANEDEPDEDEEDDDAGE